MRLPMLSLYLIAAALLGEIQAASAQSAYSYPWSHLQNCSGAMNFPPG
jgi:hypothetical protein